MRHRDADDRTCLKLVGGKLRGDRRLTRPVSAHTSGSLTEKQYAILIDGRGTCPAASTDTCKLFAVRRFQTTTSIRQRVSARRRTTEKSWPQSTVQLFPPITTGCAPNIPDGRRGGSDHMASPAEPLHPYRAVRRWKIAGWAFGDAQTGTYPVALPAAKRCWRYRWRGPLINAESVGMAPPISWGKYWPCSPMPTRSAGAKRLKPGSRPWPTALIVSDGADHRHDRSGTMQLSRQRLSSDGPISTR